MLNFRGVCWNLLYQSQGSPMNQILQQHWRRSGTSNRPRVGRPTFVAWLEIPKNLGKQWYFWLMSQWLRRVNYTNLVHQLLRPKKAWNGVEDLAAEVFDQVSMVIRLEMETSLKERSRDYLSKMTDKSLHSKLNYSGHLGRSRVCTSNFFSGSSRQLQKMSNERQGSFFIFLLL